MEESFSLSEVFSYCESETNIPDESEIDPHVGVVFHPTHEEAIQILEFKSSNPEHKFDAIYEANIYEYDPPELQGLGAIQSAGKFYFFCQLKPLDDSGKRFNRSAGRPETGYWKVTGKKFTIKAKGTDKKIGRKRTLVFYKRSRGGYEERTNWVMQEYSGENTPQNLVVCKIKEKKEKVKKEDKKRRVSTKKDKKPAKKGRFSTDAEGQSSKSVALDNLNHTQSPILSEQGSNHTESPILSEQGSNHTESPILPDQGSSLSSIFSIENDVWNSHLGSSSSPQGPNENHTAPPILPEQGSLSAIVSCIENYEWNSLLGSSSSTQDFNGNHTGLPILPEQGSSSSILSSNGNDARNSLPGSSSSSHGSNGNYTQSLVLPEQGPSSSIVSSNENDVWNSLDTVWDYSPQFSLNPAEFLQQNVISPDEFLHLGDGFPQQIMVSQDEFLDQGDEFLQQIVVSPDEFLKQIVVSTDEFLKQIVVSPDELLHQGDEFLHQLLAEETTHTCYTSGVTST